MTYEHLRTEWDNLFGARITHKAWLAVMPDLMRRRLQPHGLAEVRRLVPLYIAGHALSRTLAEMDRKEKQP